MMFENPFLMMALWAGLLASISSGVIGSYVVVRRISFIAGSVAHSVLGGMGFCLWLQRTWSLQWAEPMLGAFAGLIYAPSAAFGAFWGVPFLMQTHGFTKMDAAFCTSMIWVGWAIGSPLIGWLSDHTGLSMCRCYSKPKLNSLCGLRCRSAIDDSVTLASSRPAHSSNSSWLVMWTMFPSSFSHSASASTHRSAELWNVKQEMRKQ